MLTIGDQMPEFRLKSVVSTNPKEAFKEITSQDFKAEWKVFFFWPKDFTFVCPTELVGFNDLYDSFKSRNAQLMGISIDSEFVHHAWMVSRSDLSKIRFPMLSDIKRELSSALGVLDKKEGVALRATIIVDPDNTIRHVSVNDLSVGRNPTEILRVLDALQTEGLCPCNWEKGQDTLKVA